MNMSSTSQTSSVNRAVSTTPIRTSIKVTPQQMVNHSSLILDKVTSIKQFQSKEKYSKYSPIRSFFISKFLLLNLLK